MFKKIILSVLATSFAVTAAAEGRSPRVSYTRDDAGNFYIHEPLPVTFDAEQTAALANAETFIRAQLKNLQSMRGADPNGDLKAINANIDALNARLDMLLSVSSKLYTEINPFTFKYFQAFPTAIIAFVGVNADKNVFKFVSLGGSAAVGAVIVPERVTKIPADGGPKETKVDFTNSSIILMPLGVAAVTGSPGAIVPGAEALPPNTSSTGVRGGVGFVWGELNNSSELTGLVGGGTVTVNLGVNVNGKLLAVKNKDKRGAVSNYVLLLGVQKASALTGKIPFTNISAEFGINGGYFADAGSLYAGASDLAKGVGALITGQRGNTDATLSNKPKKEFNE